MNTHTYLRYCLNENNITELQLLKFTDKESILAKVDSESIKSNRLLVLTIELSKILNNGDYLYSHIKPTKKSLDNIIALGYDIELFKLNDGKFLGTISKIYKKQRYDVFITTNDTLKSAFETLDTKIYNKFGHFPDCFSENAENIDDYSKKIMKRKRYLKRHIKSSF